MPTDENSNAEINQIGKIIAYERYLAGISAEQLCTGICSRSYLARIESGERGCEKIVSEALLQRLGVSPGSFLYFLNPKEQQWLLVREKLIQAVNGNLPGVYRSCWNEYETLTKGKSRLHRQFLLLAESMWDWKISKAANRMSSVRWNGVIEKLRKAWSITQLTSVLEEPGLERMSYTELFIKSLYFHIQEELGKKQEALKGYRGLLQYLEEKVDDREQAVLYPQIGYQVLLLLEQEGVGKREEAKQVYQACISVLKRQGGIHQLPQLLEYQLRQLRKADEEGRLSLGVWREIEETEALYSSLRWLYRTYSVEPTEWIWYPTDEMEEIHLLSDMIKGRRQAMGLTQEKLAEGICDPVTISRIESGLVVPKQGVLVKLLEKLHVPGGDIVISAQVGKPELYRKVGDISALTKFGKNEEALSLVEELKEQVAHNRYVDQYLLSLETQTLYGMQKIDSATEQKRLWKALYLSVPEAEPEFLQTWTFTKTEAAIINGISYGCEDVGQREKGIKWLRLLQQYYERQPLTRRYGMANYEIALRNLGNLLGNQQEYEEAIRIEDVAIRMALETGSGNMMRIILYDRAWNMEQLWTRGDYSKKESRNYMRAALELAYLFARPSALRFVEQHWKEYYEND